MHIDPQDHRVERQQQRRVSEHEVKRAVKYGIPHPDPQGDPRGASKGRSRVPHGVKQLAASRPVIGVSLAPSPRQNPPLLTYIYSAGTPAAHRSDSLVAHSVARGPLSLCPRMGIEWAEDSPAQRAQIQTLYEVQRVINPSPAASVVPAQTAHSRSADRVQSIKGLRGFSERSCKAAVKYCEKGHSALHPSPLE